MNFHDDEAAAMMEREMMDEWNDRFAPVATMSDAHSEWHRNSGNPMGTPGCPMDACHPPEPEWCEEHDTYADECACHDDGAPVHQWQVTEPADVYVTDETWGEFYF